MIGGILCSLVGSAGVALALPGQSVTEVEAWIQGHPTLRPGENERLLISRSDTPAQRFTFRASSLPPRQMPGIYDPRVIRFEQFTLFDMINGVTYERLEESLRVIYGPQIYADYRRALPIYTYPNESTPPPGNPDLLVQGQVRLGEAYGYWIEVVGDPNGLVYTGQIGVLLKEDAESLAAVLQPAGAE